MAAPHKEEERSLQRGSVSGHGFRSGLKDWAHERDIGETLSAFALAHVEGSAAVAVYPRDDLLGKPRPVMQRWADFIAEQ